MISLMINFIKNDAEIQKAAAFAFEFFIGLIPIAFGLIPLLTGARKKYFCVNENRIKKSGEETTAKIAGFKTVSHKGILNRRFALQLIYFMNGSHRRFTTNYIYDINELHYLQSLNSIKIKTDGKFAAVVESFPETIYNIDPRFEIEAEFFK